MQRTFVHQFRQLATPRHETRSGGRPPYTYRTRHSTPRLGTAAAKAEQAEKRRRDHVAALRLGAKVKARNQRRPENVARLDDGRKNRGELRLDARAAFVAALSLQTKTLAELWEWHRANGTLTAFINSLRALKIAAYH